MPPASLSPASPVVNVEAGWYFSFARCENVPHPGLAACSAGQAPLGCEVVILLG